MMPSLYVLLSGLIVDGIRVIKTDREAPQATLDEVSPPAELASLGLDKVTFPQCPSGYHKYCGKSRGKKCSKFCTSTYCCNCAGINGCPKAFTYESKHILIVNKAFVPNYGCMFQHHKNYGAVSQINNNWSKEAPDGYVIGRFESNYSFTKKDRTFRVGFAEVAPHNLTIKGAHKWSDWNSAQNSAQYCNRMSGGYHVLTGIASQINGKDRRWRIRCSKIHKGNTAGYMKTLRNGSAQLNNFISGTDERNFKLDAASNGAGWYQYGNDWMPTGLQSSYNNTMEDRRFRMYFEQICRL